jgi:hypothetical protein
MKKQFSFFSLFLLFALYALAQNFDPQPLKNEIAGLEQTIVKAKAESAKYTGGLVKALLDSRIQIYEHTKALLEQRLAAGNYGVSIKYTVDGKEYVPPYDKDKIIQDLEKEAINTTKEMESAQKEADRYSGGLVKAMKLATVATFEQQLAMIEMKRCAVIYDIPLYTFLGGASLTLASSPSEKLNETPAEIDGMFEIKLIGKRVYTANYSDRLAFDFLFTNHTEKDIKAVKGIAHFFDLFDTEIQSVGFTVEYDVPAGQSVKNSRYSMELNKFNANNSRLRSIEMDNLKMRFEVESIIFKDGSIVKR